MKKILILTLTLMGVLSANAAAINQKIWDNPDTIVVARDGSGQFRNINEAIDVCRAFTDYHKVIFVKKGTYKEKLIVPSYVENIEICGESRDETIITYDDHANITDPSIPNNHRIGTFGSYTLKIEGNNIKLKNITVENNALGGLVRKHVKALYNVFNVLEIFKMVSVNVEYNRNVREEFQEVVLVFTAFADHYAA